jgi:hypothetical protein
MVLINLQLADTLHHLGIDDKLMHLTNATVLTISIIFLIMMFGMFIIDVAILLALLLNHTDTPHVVMMGHHRG